MRHHNALSEEEIKRTREALKKAGTITGAAQALGISRSSMQNRVRLYVEKREEAQAQSEPESRQSFASAEFWRTRARELERELVTVETAFRELAGLVSRPISPPPFLFPSSPSSDDLKKSVGLLHISDVHAGEVVEKDEILGINAYDLDICKERLQRLFRATLEILPRWSSDTELSGIVVALNGDLVSGSIHEELAETDALTSQQQAWFVADELAAGIGALADAFGSVFVIVTPGNHGRQHRKPRFKRVAASSYDTAVGEMLRRHYRNDPRVNFHIAPGKDAVIPVLGWQLLVTHGDNTLRGGAGFLGPGGPILRGTKMLEWQAAQVKREYDIICLGHLHCSMNPGKVLANGSVIGVNEYSHGMRLSADLPRQWLALVTEKYPIRERCDLVLEDPIKPDKPRIRVPSRTLDD